MLLSAQIMTEVSQQWLHKSNVDLAPHQYLDFEELHFICQKSETASLLAQGSNDQKIY